MRDKERWISRSIQLESDFCSYKAQVSLVASSELTNPTSRYGVIKGLVEDTSTIVEAAIIMVEQADLLCEGVIIDSAGVLLENRRARRNAAHVRHCAWSLRIEAVDRVAAQVGD